MTVILHQADWIIDTATETEQLGKHSIRPRSDAPDSKMILANEVSMRKSF
jgi:hypothetical protein